MERVAAAGAKETDLEEVATVVAAETLAFPMTVAESLAGAVVCRPRDGDQCAPDVRSALAEVARNLGMSLYILRDREQARLVAASPPIAWSSPLRAAAPCC